MKKWPFLAIIFACASVLQATSLPHCEVTPFWTLAQKDGRADALLEKLTRQIGAVRLEVCADKKGVSAVRLKKEVGLATAYFFSADVGKNAELSNIEISTYARLETLENGHKIAFSDPRGNALEVEIRANGDIVILSGFGPDVLDVDVEKKVEIGGSVRFAKFQIAASNVHLTGEIDAKKFVINGKHLALNGQFLNEGTLRADVCELQNVRGKNEGIIRAKNLQIGLLGELANNGSIHASERVECGGNGILRNFGTVASDGEAVIKPIGGLVNNGSIFAEKSLIFSNSRVVFRNEKNGRIASATAIKIASGGRSFANFGTIETPRLEVDKTLFFVGSSGIVSTNAADVKSDTLHNNGQILASELISRVAHLDGSGVIKMTNGAIEVSNPHQNLATIECEKNCAFDAHEERNFGVFATPGGDGKFSVNAQNGDILNANELQCGEGRECSFSAAQNIANAANGKIVTDGNLAQEAGQSVVSDGKITGGGSYAADAGGDFSNRGTINLGNDFVAKSKNDASNEGSIFARNGQLSAGKNCENSKSGDFRTTEKSVLSSSTRCKIAGTRWRASWPTGPIWRRTR